MQYDDYNCNGDCESCPPQCPLDQSCGGYSDCSVGEEG